MLVRCAWCDWVVREKDGEGPDDHGSICPSCLVLHFPVEAAAMGLFAVGGMEGERREMELRAQVALLVVFLIGLGALLALRPWE